MDDRAARRPLLQAFPGSRGDDGTLAKGLQIILSPILYSFCKSSE
jgi:hypothetical protein